MPWSGAKNADANIKQVNGRWDMRVKLVLPDHSILERKGSASSRTAARKLRDDLYATYNALALNIIAAIPGEDPLERPRMTLKELAAKCRDEWWPARGRSTDIAEQLIETQIC